MLLLASFPAGSTIAIILAASAGLVGAIVSLLKLKPEANQSAVLQAQGAVETMAQVQDELEKTLARANARADRESARAERYRALYLELRGSDEHIPPEKE